MTCPKCKAPRPAGAVECPLCGVIYARFEAAAAKKRAADADAKTAEPPPPSESAKLVNCPACGNPVSVLADNCPACGHPVDKSLRLSPLERKLNQVVGIVAAVVVLGVLYGIHSCSDRLANPHKYITAKSEENRPAPATVKRPDIPRNVPLNISPDAYILGCHDIADYWMLRGFRDGPAKEYRHQLQPRMTSGKCGAVPPGKAVAVEILPTGVAEIKDSRGAKWYVDDSALRQNRAY